MRPEEPDRSRANPARKSLNERRQNRVSATEQVAAVTQQLAVLLTAGVSPVSAWGYLLPVPGTAELLSDSAVSVSRREEADKGGETWVTRGVLQAAARAAASGDSVADAIALQAHRQTIKTDAPETDLGSVRLWRTRERRAAVLEAEQAWRGLAAAWLVATQSGAPLAGCLRELAASLRELAQVQRDLEVALAAPQATA